MEIALDFTELRTLAAAEGVSVPDLLTRFRQAGATSVALDEETIGGLEGARRLQVEPVTDPGRTVLRPAPELAPRIRDAFARRSHFTLEPGATEEEIAVAQPYSAVRAVGIGIDPEAAQMIQAAGLRVVGRVSNYTGITGIGLSETLGQLKTAGASTVIFLGDDVVGFKGQISGGVLGGKLRVGGSSEPTTASAMDSLALNYGTVEFGKQKGDAELVRALPERTVRVHTVPGAEMINADIPGNVQRFLLAARERNIRLLFVRLFMEEENPLEKNAAYIKRISDGLKRAGLVPGVAHGYGELTTPLWCRVVIGLGVAAAWLLLCDAMTGLFVGGAGGLVSLAAWGGALLVVLLPLGGYKGTELCALAAGCIFPSLALLYKDALRPGDGYPPLQVALLRFGRACLTTAIGIAAIVGLLSDRLFLIKAESFVGVKATLVVPLLLVALAYAMGLRVGNEEKGRTWRGVLKQAQTTLQKLAVEPILIWQVAAGFIALVALAMLVMRSGNDPGVGVSGLELKVRSLLDQYLPARPRFKDIFAHPALLIAFALAARGYRKAAIPLVIVGVIAQTSLLNAFCHLHTPLPVGLTRALLGIVFGVIIGVGLWLLIDRFILRRFPAHAAS